MTLGGIAQLVERLVRNEKARGSTPLTSTKVSLPGREESRLTGKDHAVKQVPMVPFPMRAFLTLLVAFLLQPCGLLRASEGGLWKSLSTKQQEQLVAGKPVVVEQDVPGNPWPRFTVYHLVESSPRKVAAVFWNSEIDSLYIPNCTSVQVLSKPKSFIQEAEYTLKMPFVLPDEVYLSRNEIRHLPPGSYEVVWKVIRSRYTKACEGSLLIEPLGEDGERSIIRYINLVEPGSKFAVLLRSKAGVQLIESVSALVKQVDQEVKKTPGLLEKQIVALEKDLGLQPLTRESPRR